MHQGMPQMPNTDQLPQIVQCTKFWHPSSLLVDLSTQPKMPHYTSGLHTFKYEQRECGISEINCLPESRVVPQEFKDVLKWLLR